MKETDVSEMLNDYNTGQYTVKMISEKYGISVGKAYKDLNKAGCVFSRKWRKPITQEFRKRMSERNKGKKISEEQRRKISENNSCNYNGLNGYGHTKDHNQGYVLAYAPKHPHAHKDGYVMLHTVILERSLGRYLEDDEVAHHINHNKKDNRIENLELMKKREHMSMHMKERHEKRRNDLSIA